VVFESPVTKVSHHDGRAVSVTAGGSTYDARPRDLVDAFNHLLRAMDPPVPAAVQQAADDLTFRDFLSVALVVPADKVAWTDNWIYIHAPEVKTMRVQNFGSWSPHMVKDGHNVLGLEYTVAGGRRVVDGHRRGAHREGQGRARGAGPHAGRRRRGGLRGADAQGVPRVRRDLRANVEVLRAWLTEHAPNVHPVGRNGMHKYNNQDHSMYTAMLTVENLFGASHDIWDVNVEEEYHEEGDGGAKAPAATPRSSRSGPSALSGPAGPPSRRRHGDAEHGGAEGHRDPAKQLPLDQVSTNAGHVDQRDV